MWLVTHPDGLPTRKQSVMLCWCSSTLIWIISAQSSCSIRNFRHTVGLACRLKNRTAQWALCRLAGVPTEWCAVSEFDYRQHRGSINQWKQRSVEYWTIAVSSGGVAWSLSRVFMRFERADCVRVYTLILMCTVYIILLLNLVQLFLRALAWNSLPPEIKTTSLTRGQFSGRPKTEKVST